MSARGLVHDHTFIFDGTNYDIWKIRMLSIFRSMDPNIERIVDMGFSRPMDSENLSLEDEKNLYLEAQAFNVIINSLSNVVISSIAPFRSTHVLWTKLQDKYDASNIIEDDCIPSTSGRDEFSFSSTSPSCGKTQRNAKVSGDEFCNVDGEHSIDDLSSLSHCNASSLDLNTSSTINDIHACVDSPRISCVNSLSKSHDDMLATSCRHNINASISSSCCVSNNVEETEDHIGQRQDDVPLVADRAPSPRPDYPASATGLSGRPDIPASHTGLSGPGASSSSSSPSSLGSHVCLMAKSSRDDEEYEEEEDCIASLHEKGEIVFRVLGKDKIALSNFIEILTIAIESQKLIEKHESTIFKME